MSEPFKSMTNWNTSASSGGPCIIEGGCLHLAHFDVKVRSIRGPHYNHSETDEQTIVKEKKATT